MSATGLVGPEGAAIANAVSRPIPEEPHEGGASRAGGAGHARGRGRAQHHRAWLPRLHPRRRPARDRDRRPRRRPAEPLHRPRSGGARPQPAGVRRAAVARERVRLRPRGGRPPDIGGSLSVWSAMVAARHARFGDVAVPADARAYTSTQAHRSVLKALRLAGHATEALCPVAVGRALPDGSGRAGRRHHARPRAGPPALPGGGDRGHHEHGRGRSPARGRGRVRPPRPVAPRGRRVRRRVRALAPRAARCCAASSAPTRSRSTPTRACSSPTARARCWCATARRSGARTSAKRTTCRTWTWKRAAAPAPPSTVPS